MFIKSFPFNFQRRKGCWLFNGVHFSSAHSKSTCEICNACFYQISCISFKWQQTSWTTNSNVNSWNNLSFVGFICLHRFVSWVPRKYKNIVWIVHAFYLTLKKLLFIGCLWGQFSTVHLFFITGFYWKYHERFCILLFTVSSGIEDVLWIKSTFWSWMKKLEPECTFQTFFQLYSKATEIIWSLFSFYRSYLGYSRAVIFSHSQYEEWKENNNNV